MKRQLEISTFVSHPAKKLKINVKYNGAQLSGVQDKITIEVESERTSRHWSRPIYADSNGHLYHQKTKCQIPQRKIKSGYMTARIPKPFGEKGYVTVLVHRIVWECFNGVIPPTKQMDHINNNRADNRLSNLQLLTPKENSRKAARRPGWVNPIDYKAIPVIATCLDQCQQKEFSSMTEAAKVLGVRSNRVSDIIAGLTKSTTAIDGRRYTFHKA